VPTPAHVAAKGRLEQVGVRRGAERPSGQERNQPPAEYLSPARDAHDAIDLEVRVDAALLGEQPALYGALTEAIERAFDQPVRVKVVAWNGEGFNVEALSPVDYDQLSGRQATSLDAQLVEFEDRATEAVDRLLFPAVRA
jgi:hypothetical protein